MRNSRKTLKLSEIVNENNNLKDKPIRNLYTTLPILIDYIINSTKNNISANISSNYPHLTNNKTYTLSYTILDGNIYRMLSDPKANIMDPANSSMDKISKNEFMKWVKEDDARALDVYNHIQKYIKMLPKLKTNSDNKKYLETMMKCV